MLAGMGCGMIQVFITNPISVVKIRLQMQNSEETMKKGPLRIAKDLGFRGLYTGLNATILRDVPFSMVYFPTYQGMKTYFRNQHKQKNDDSDLSAIELLIASCMDIGHIGRKFLRKMVFA